MSTKFEQESLNATPYFDDFDETKNFLRLLSNPSRAVQSRELTQAQTVLHNQITKFGNHFFKEGTNVLGGKIKLRQRVTLLVEQSELQISPAGIAAGTTDFLNKHVRGQTSNALGRIVQIEENVSTSPTVQHRFHIAVRGGSFVDGEQIITENYDTDTYVTQYETDVTGVGITIGKSIMANISPGLFYVGGSFIINAEQEIIVNGASDTGKYRIGFLYNEEVITYLEDATLLDPANGAPNANAPGADRYKGSITLSAYLDGDILPDNYFNIMLEENGNILEYNEGTEYTEILKILARRTYDESGSYTINDFSCAVTEADPSTINYNISPFKAYIKGFEHETISDTVISASKPRTLKAVNNETNSVQYGTFINVSNNGSDSILNFFDSNSHPLVYLMSGLNGTGSVVGTARLLYTKRVGVNLRVWLGDSNSIRTDLKSTKSIANASTAATIYYNTDTFSADSQYNNFCPILQMNSSPVNSVTATSYISEKTYSAVNKNVNGHLVLQADTNYINFMDDSVVLVKDSTGAIPTYAGVVVTNTDNTSKSSLTIQTPTSTGPFTALVRTTNTAGLHKSKTLTLVTSNTFTATATSELLNHFDIDRVLEIYNTTDDPSKTNNLIYRSVTLDTGRRDFYYDYGSLKGLEIGKDYEVTYLYYAHAGTGHYFTADSYLDPNGYYSSDNANFVLQDAGITMDVYSVIPTYKDSRNIKVYSLRSCMDFRKTITEFTSDSILIEPGASTVIDYDFYLQRIDKIWIDMSGNIGVTEGIEETSAISPPDQHNTMTMFEVYLRPYTFVLNDVDPIKQKTKTYTMSDISQLERRLNAIEYYTSYNLLEQNAYAQNVVDSSGLPRSKNGMFVDTFGHHGNGNLSDTAYRCSMDYGKGILKSPFEMNYIDLKYNTAEANSNVTVHDNIITLAYTSTAFIEQLFSSETININPYDVFTWNGTLTLSPSNDNWVDTTRLPARNVEMTGLNDVIQSITSQMQPAVSSTSEVLGVSKRRENIKGHEEGDIFKTLNSDKMLQDQAARRAHSIQRGDPADLTDAVANALGETHEITTTTTQTTTVTKTPTFTPGSQTKNLGDRVVDVSIAPFMRSKTIAFSGSGFKPSTTLRAWFNDIEVTAFCTGLVTNTKGIVNGIFTIPEGTFRTGTLQFELKDKLTDPGTTGVAEYTASGLMTSRESTILSMDMPSVGVSSSTSVSKSSAQERQFVDWFDPIAQSFLVSQKGGVFLESIDIFFATKDNNIPVTLQIVSNDEGYPSQLVVPYSKVNLDAYNVRASRYDSLTGNYYYVGDNDIGLDGDVISGATGLTPTNFKFSDPVYLQEGVEYSFVLLTNCTAYEVYISKIGGLNTITGKVIEKQPYTGVMFKSQNASTWSADQNRDVMFSINKCQFNNPLSGAVFMNPDYLADKWVNNINYTVGDRIIYQSGTFVGYFECAVDNVGISPVITGSTSEWTYLGKAAYDATSINLNIDTMEVSGTRITKSYKLFNDVAYNKFNPKDDLLLDNRNTLELFNPGADTPEDIDVKLEFATTDVNLTPCIHKYRSGVVALNNLTKDMTTYQDAGTYITKNTQILKKAADLMVLLDEKAYNGAEVIVSYKSTLHHRKYAEITTSSTLYESFKDNIAYVYWFNDPLTPTNDGTAELVAGWTYKSKVIIDGVNGNQGTNGFMYMSSIEDYTSFVDAVDFASNSITNILVTTEPDITSTEIYAYETAATYALADYVIHNNTLWQSNVAGNSVEPSIGATDWDEIGCMFIDSVVNDIEVEWQEMTPDGTVFDEIDRKNQYVERTFKPTITPTETFDTFAIKVEMQSQNAVDIPYVKNLRAIAVS